MTKPIWLWDVDLTDEQFSDILRGRSRGPLDEDWAAVRLLEYARYDEIVKRLNLKELIAGWPRWRPRVRAQSRRRGIDFITEWIPRHHPEWLR